MFSMRYSIWGFKEVLEVVAYIEHGMGSEGVRGLLPWKTGCRRVMGIKTRWGKPLHRLQALGILRDFLIQNLLQTEEKTKVQGGQ